MTMRFILYSQSLLSDWNHGNAHFLRGILRELAARGHDVVALEPQESWSRQNLVADQGSAALERFQRDFPEIRTQIYDAAFDHEAVLSFADVVIVHEWTAPEIVARIGRYRRRGAGFTLLFHDTHHRAVSDSAGIAALLLEDYDGILVFGESLRQRYVAQGWGKQSFTWHEAADARQFRPPAGEAESTGDLIWIGNWGDGERTAELREFLFDPVSSLGLSGTVHGVRYPPDGLRMLTLAGLVYRGWLANADVPAAFSRHRATLHIPRRPYVEALPGIPTIRVFEALACGIPLICSPWNDTEGLFRPGQDYLQAKNGTEMRQCLMDVLHDRQLAAALSRSGLETIRARHTCRHRVDQLFGILRQVGHSGIVTRISAMEAA